MDNFSRPLDNNQVVESFLKYSLQLDYSNDPKLKKIIGRIVDGELGVSRFNEDAQTMNARHMRDASCRDDDKRWELRAKIISELWTKKRLTDDENIVLGKGGALPKSEIKSERKAFILIGLPASGKSGIAAGIAEDFGAIIVDSDYAKRKLPEYTVHLYGASIVHEESSQITFGFKPDNPRKLQSLYEQCIENERNIVVPRIGQNPESIINLATTLKSKNNYRVHLVLVSLSKRLSTIRAVYRYAETGRYVPLGLIFDGYGNDPSHCYYYLRCKHSNLFESMGAVSTVEKTPQHIDAEGESPVLKYNYKSVILQLP
jgi:hypothetical protein